MLKQQRSANAPHPDSAAKADIEERNHTVTAFLADEYMEGLTVDLGATSNLGGSGWYKAPSQARGWFL